ncbi:unnamed protein product [Echinostoma caproni]|uniref:Myb_DNA-bind_5 domain-containing protein n=1 Tax=Echinostoma caproni TaxID=27848 RepID=A0A183BCG2_9TREM|nr:unnamed protein product [Echinostoma caproni]
MQAPTLLGPLGVTNNSHMNQTIQQQHMAQEQQQHPPTSMTGLADPTFPVAATPPMPVSSTGLMASFDSCTVSQTVTPVSSSGLASLFGSPPKPRTESFAYDEVKILLQEIELRKHVLLSISPSMNRFKRRAWEEVSVSMANRCPYAPRRTADQVSPGSRDHLIS